MSQMAEPMLRLLPLTASRRDRCLRLTLREYCCCHRDDEISEIQKSHGMRIAELEGELAEARSRVATHASAIAAAEERVLSQTARADKLHVEKSALSRDVGAIRGEAISSRERADIMQKMVGTTIIIEHRAALQLARAA